MDPILLCERWFTTAVLGLNLCPYAHKPAAENRIRWCSATEADLFPALEVEINRLLATDASVLETTLIIVTQGLADFQAYLAALAAVERYLAAAGLEGVLQCASFHPQYEFADAPADDPSHYSNRSPYPIFHLLREASISAIVDSGADLDAIYQRNQARLRDMPRAKLQALWRQWTLPVNGSTADD